MKEADDGRKGKVIRGVYLVFLRRREELWPSNGSGLGLWKETADFNPLARWKIKRRFFYC